MKATCETVETRRFELTAEDVRNLIKRELQQQYGVEVVAENIEFDIEDDHYGYGAVVGATYMMQTRL